MPSESAVVSTVIDVEWGPGGLWDAPVAEPHAPHARGQPHRGNHPATEGNKKELGHGLFGDKLVLWQGRTVWTGRQVRLRPPLVSPSRVKPRDAFSPDPPGDGGYHVAQQAAAESRKRSKGEGGAAQQAASIGGGPNDVLDLGKMPGPPAPMGSSSSSKRPPMQLGSVEEEAFEDVWEDASPSAGGLLAVGVVDLADAARPGTSEAAAHPAPAGGEAASAGASKASTNKKPAAASRSNSNLKSSRSGASSLRGSQSSSFVDDDPAPPPMNPALAGFARRKQEEKKLEAEPPPLNPALAGFAQRRVAEQKLDDEDRRLQAQQPALNPALAGFAQRQAGKDTAEVAGGAGDVEHTEVVGDEESSTNYNNHDGFDGELDVDVPPPPLDPALANFAQRKAREQKLRAEEQRLVEQEPPPLNPVLAGFATRKQAEQKLEQEDKRLQEEVTELNPVLAGFAARNANATVNGNAARAGAGGTAAEAAPSDGQPPAEAEEPAAEREPVSAAEQDQEQDQAPAPDVEAQRVLLTEGTHESEPLSPINVPASKVSFDLKPPVVKPMGTRPQLQRQGSSFPPGVTVRDDPGALEVFSSLVNAPAWLMLEQFEKPENEPEEIKKEVLEYRKSVRLGGQSKKMKSSATASASPGAMLQSKKAPAQRASSGGRRLREYHQESGGRRNLESRSSAGTQGSSSSKDDLLKMSQKSVEGSELRSSSHDRSRSTNLEAQSHMSDAPPAQLSSSMEGHQHRSLDSVGAGGAGPSRDRGTLYHSGSLSEHGSLSPQDKTWRDLFYQSKRREGFEHPATVTAACMLSGRLLVSATEDGFLFLWDVDSQQVRASIHLAAAVEKSEREAQQQAKKTALTGTILSHHKTPPDPCFASAVWLRENIENIRETQFDVQEKTEDRNHLLEWKERQRASTSPGKMRSRRGSGDLPVEVSRELNTSVHSLDDGALAPAQLDAARVTTAPTDKAGGPNANVPLADRALAPESGAGNATATPSRTTSTIVITSIVPHPSDARFLLLVSDAWVFWTDITLQYVRVYLQLEGPSSLSQQPHVGGRERETPTSRTTSSVSVVWWDNPAALRRRAREKDRYRFAVVGRTLKTYDVRIPEKQLPPPPGKRQGPNYVPFFDPPPPQVSWDLRRDFSEPRESCAIPHAGSWGAIQSVHFRDKGTLFFLAVSPNGAHLTLWLLSVASKKVIPLKQFACDTTELFFFPGRNLGILEWFQPEVERLEEWCGKFSTISLNYDGDAWELTFTATRTEWFGPDTSVLSSVLELADDQQDASRPGSMREHMSMRKKRRAEYFQGRSAGAANGGNASPTTEPRSSSPLQHPAPAGLQIANRCPLKGQIVPLLLSHGHLYLKYPKLNTFCSVTFATPLNNPNVYARYRSWDTKVSTLAGPEPDTVGGNGSGPFLTKQQLRSLSLQQSIESMILESPFLRPSRSSPFSIQYKAKPKKRLPTLAKAPKLGLTKKTEISVSVGGSSTSQSLPEHSSTLLDEEAPTHQASMRERREKPKGMHFANGVPDGATLLEKARKAYAKRHEAKAAKKIRALYEEESLLYTKTLLQHIYARSVQHVIRAQTPMSGKDAFDDYPRSALAASMRHPIGGRSMLRGTTGPLYSRERLGKGDDYLVDSNLFRYDCLPAEDLNVPWFTHRPGAGGGGYQPHRK